MRRSRKRVNENRGYSWMEIHHVTRWQCPDCTALFVLYACNEETRQATAVQEVAVHYGGIELAFPHDICATCQTMWDVI